MHLDNFIYRRKNYFKENKNKEMEPNIYIL